MPLLSVWNNSLTSKLSQLGKLNNSVKSAVWLEKLTESKIEHKQH